MAVIKAHDMAPVASAAIFASALIVLTHVSWRTKDKESSKERAAKMKQ
jgi:hypothetical protein